MEKEGREFKITDIQTELVDNKILTIAVPAYNAAKFLPRSLEPFTELDQAAKESLEVIIVNDGSKDNTAEIAQQYVDKYPEMFKVVNKENGGHGSGVNYGMQHGVGMYYYVLDADDWLNPQALTLTLDKLKAMRKAFLQDSSSPLPDLLLVDYTYENIEEGKNRISLKKQVPVEKFFQFHESKSFTQGTYLTMHSMIYRRQILHDASLVLPEHCFYVDNLLAYIPLPYCRQIYYLPVELYHYEVGRDDQSVNENNFIKRIDQQIRVTKLLTQAYHLYSDLPGKENQKIRQYLLHYLAAMYTVSVVHLIMIDTPESKEKIRNLWHFLQTFDKKMYAAVRRSLPNVLLNLPLGNKAIGMFYHVVKKIFKFN